MALSLRAAAPRSARRLVGPRHGGGVLLSAGARPPAPPPAERLRRVLRRIFFFLRGGYISDERCIDCSTCRWMALEVFKRVDGLSAVAAQPSSQDDRTKALQGVYLCGYHSESSYGATSYLIVHPEGNIMVDSPRYTPKLVNQIEKLGGARYMFLTHIDDVADHRKWAEWLKCERIIHSGDGSVCLLHKPLKALFTGDHVAKSEESDDLNLFRMYSKQSVSAQLDSMTKLLDLDFQWVLPGHGYRIRYEDAQAKNSAIESLLTKYKI